MSTANPESNKHVERRLAKAFALEAEFPEPLRTLVLESPTLTEVAKDCLFALDANVLLAPYAVGEKTVEEIDKVYSQLVEDRRLFVPARSLREYLRHRDKWLGHNYDHLYRRYWSAVPNFDRLHCPMLEGLPAYEALLEQIAILQTPLKEYRSRLETLMGVVQDWAWNDKLTSLYKRLFDDSVVIECQKPRHELLEDMTVRFEQVRPPGFEDKGKTDEGIGDVVIWHTILELGQKECKNVIFVSNEEKRDWVVKVKDEKNSVVLAARPELVDEFSRHTNGKHFRVVSYSRFLEAGGAAPDVVDLAKEVELGTSIPDENNARLSPGDLLAHILGICHFITTSDDVLKTSMSPRCYRLHEHAAMAVSDIDRVRATDFPIPTTMLNCLSQIRNIHFAIRNGNRSEELLDKLTKQCELFLVLYPRVRTSVFYERLIRLP